MKKKGILFVIDTVLAISLLLVGILVILASRTSAPITIQGEVLSSDFLEQFHEVKIREVNSRFILEQRLAGNINSSLEQKALVHLAIHYLEAGSITNATKVVNETAGRVVPVNFNMRYLIDDTVVFERLNKALDVEDAPVVLSDRRVYFNELDGTLVGPHTSTVIVW